MAEDRQVVIKTPLGDSELLFSQMQGVEEMGRLFSYELSLYSVNEDITIDDILGQNVTIVLELAGGQSRYFNGYVSEFSQSGRTEGGYAIYQATVRPWLWFLTRTADCRIFQEKTVPEIIKEVFSDSGFSDFEESLTGQYRQWEYCVQYRETDFNFVSRLMEQEGIYYYFKHEDGKHTLVLSDSHSSHHPIEGNSRLPYHPPGLDQTLETDHVSDWKIQRKIQSGSFKVSDYNFKIPRSGLLASRVVDREHAHADYEIYDFPGQYIDADEGDKAALYRLQELHTDYEKVSAETDARTMSVGALFSLTDHPREDQNREYLVTGASFSLRVDEYSSGGGGSVPTYMSTFTAIDGKTSYRSSSITRKPVVQGPQTAVVVGPAGEEIYPDEFGRVKVQFHWDRYGSKDENSSCWIRPSQALAGPGWGAQFIPRIGMEVLVEFLEGDPDRPLMTGAVYNANNMPPYALPENKTQSGIKTRSSPGGNSSNFNEIRMEDKKGSEELFIQAEKDETINVKNNKTETVGVDETVSIGNDRKETVGNDDTLDVGKVLKVSAGDEIELSTGLSKISMKKDGNIEITGMDLTVKNAAGTININKGGIITVKGTMVKVNS